MIRTTLIKFKILQKKLFKNQIQFLDHRNIKIYSQMRSQKIFLVQKKINNNLSSSNNNREQIEI